MIKVPSGSITHTEAKPNLEKADTNSSGTDEEKDLSEMGSNQDAPAHASSISDEVEPHDALDACNARECKKNRKRKSKKSSAASSSSSETAGLDEFPDLAQDAALQEDVCDAEEEEN